MEASSLESPVAQGILPPGAQSIAYSANRTAGFPLVGQITGTRRNSTNGDCSLLRSNLLSRPLTIRHQKTIVRPEQGAFE
jgi:hypothetical protein